ncbi:hypothetical protein BDB01DRAFT_798230 [Pilobolus umbonatus]|nr:hypothetical protein BDB01DRAFT_798230 [Pilobolus umbonatus]
MIYGVPWSKIPIGNHQTIWVLLSQFCDVTIGFALAITLLGSLLRLGEMLFPLFFYLVISQSETYTFFNYWSRLCK